MKMDVKITGVLTLSLALLTGCNFNPFAPLDTKPTGNPGGAVIGAAAGAGGMSLLGAGKTAMALTGIAGGALGYYVTTLRYDAGGIIDTGGTVYQIGDMIGVYIPTDNVFEPNTAEFLPQAGPILDSAVAVLQHKPNNNIIISGNTAGFYRDRWEEQLSEKRAQRVSAYLWNAGINDFKDRSNSLRKLNYVGYGDYFPIAHSYTNNSLRKNSRIQIVSYPSNCDLGLGKGAVAMRNFGALNDGDAPEAAACDSGGCDN